jgi:hypothetical protein
MDAVLLKILKQGLLSQVLAVSNETAHTETPEQNGMTVLIDV